MSGETERVRHIYDESAGDYDRKSRYPQRLAVHPTTEEAIAKYMRIESKSCMTVARGPLP
jgi:hypothetical protein